MQVAIIYVRQKTKDVTDKGICLENLCNKKGKEKNEKGIISIIIISTCFHNVCSNDRLQR